VHEPQCLQHCLGVLLRVEAAARHSLHLPLQETKYHRVGAKVGLQQRPLGIA